MIVAIFFRQNSTSLAVRVATKNNADEGIWASDRSLPVNATTSVRVEAFGRDVLLFLNNIFDSMVTVSADRISGVATLYISDPWHTPASASIGSIQLESDSSLLEMADGTPLFTNASLDVTSSSDFNGHLSKFAIYERTIVPANYSLKFDIIPFGTVTRLASILHYSKDKTNMGAGGRLPGIAFEKMTN